MKTLFHVANALIALDYFLIGMFFLQRLRAANTLRHSSPKAMAAVIAAVLFFFGCVHTHMNLLLLDEISDHWYGLLDVLSHWLQGLGGFTFWVLARKYLVINIFDVVAYRRVLSHDEDERERLRYVAIKEGLMRR